jgi:4-aminobutyrate aminotransferase-like enzyme
MSEYRIPDPETASREAYDDLSAEEILALRKEYLMPNHVLYYKNPVAIVEGRMQYLFDSTGKQYLDAIAGIVTVSVGHCHPDVINKTIEQTKRLQHITSIYLNPNIVKFAKLLASKMPCPELKQSFFTNSGSEANELALLMAKLYTGNQDILVLRNAYHGDSLVTMGLCGHSTWRYNIPSIPNIHRLVQGYCYRCPFKLEYPSCKVQCAYDAQEIIDGCTTGKVAALIAEPIQGVGGTIIPPKEYFGILYDIVKKAGGIYISDEVQTGFGRTGNHFWGIQNWDVEPDAITMAKGIGNGIPLAGVTSRPEITRHLGDKTYFNTFGGNPVSTAQGIATLEVIEKEGLQENSRVVGEHLMEGLRKLDRKYSLIGEVRGMGLMVGVELVKTPEGREPASEATADVFEMAKDLGVLIGKGGLFGNVLRIKPPMCFTKDNADFLVEVLDECLKNVSNK